jgi:hypothetical protein
MCYRDRIARVGLVDMYDMTTQRNANLEERWRSASLSDQHAPRPGTPYMTSGRPETVDRGGEDIFPEAAVLNVIRQRQQDLESRRPSENDSTASRREHTRPRSTRPSPIRSDVNRPRMATFDGSEEWQPFAYQFNRMSRRFQWEHQERVDRLHESMRGPALKYVCSPPGEVQEEFSKLSGCLERRFGHVEPPATVRKKLSNIQQKSESAEEFAEEI